MLLISWGTGPFSVGACPWSLCTTAIDKHAHTLNTKAVIHHHTGRKVGDAQDKCIFRFFVVFFPLQWLDIFSCGASQHPHRAKKVMPALLYCTWRRLKEAIEERSEIPAETRAVGNPLSAPVSDYWRIINFLTDHIKKTKKQRIVIIIWHLHKINEFLSKLY